MDNKWGIQIKKFQIIKCHLFLMAVVFNGMTKAEQLALTQAMV